MTDLPGTTDSEPTDAAPTDGGPEVTPQTRAAGGVTLGSQTDILDDSGAFTSVQDFGTLVNSPHKSD